MLSVQHRPVLFALFNCNLRAFLFRPPCLENRTFWIPASARMTDYQADGRHQRPVASLTPITHHLSPAAFNSITPKFSGSWNR